MTLKWPRSAYLPGPRERRFDRRLPVSSEQVARAVTAIGLLVTVAAGMGGCV